MKANQESIRYRKVQQSPQDIGDEGQLDEQNSSETSSFTQLRAKNIGFFKYVLKYKKILILILILCGLCLYVYQLDSFRSEQLLKRTEPPIIKPKYEFMDELKIESSLKESKRIEFDSTELIILKNSNSPVNRNQQNITLSLICKSNTHLQIIISAYGSNRKTKQKFYENGHENDNKDTISCYKRFYHPLEIRFVENPFAFFVIRKDTNEILFDTSFRELIFTGNYISIIAKTPKANKYGLQASMDSLNLQDGTYSLGIRSSFITETTYNSKINSSYSEGEGFHPMILMRENAGSHSFLLQVINTQNMDITLKNQEFLHFELQSDEINLNFMVDSQTEDNKNNNNINNNITFSSENNDMNHKFDSYIPQQQNLIDSLLKQYHKQIGSNYIPPHWGFGLNIIDQINDKKGTTVPKKLFELQIFMNRERFPFDSFQTSNNLWVNKMPMTIKQTVINSLKPLKEVQIKKIIQTQSPWISLASLTSEQEYNKAVYLCAHKQFEKVFFTNHNENNPFLKYQFGNQAELKEFFGYPFGQKSLYFNYFSKEGIQLQACILEKLNNDVFPFSGIVWEYNSPLYEEENKFIEKSVFGDGNVPNLHVNRLSLPEQFPNQLPESVIYDKQSDYSQKNIGNVAPIQGLQATISNLENLDQYLLPYQISQVHPQGAGKYSGVILKIKNFNKHTPYLSILWALKMSMFGINYVGIEAAPIEKMPVVSIRLLQISSLLPIFNWVIKEELSKFDQVALIVQKEMIKQRYSILNQYYSLQVYYSNGGPLLRSLEFEFWEKDGNKNLPLHESDSIYQFLISKFIMVIAQISEQEQFYVYLPKNTLWYDFDKYKAIIPQVSDNRVLFNRKHSEPMAMLLRGGYLLFRQKSKYLLFSTEDLDYPYELIIGLDSNFEGIGYILGLQKINDINLKKTCNQTARSCLVQVYVKINITNIAQGSFLPSIMLDFQLLKQEQSQQSSIILDQCIKVSEIVIMGLQVSSDLQKSISKELFILDLEKKQIVTIVNILTMDSERIIFQVKNTNNLCFQPSKKYKIVDEFHEDSQFQSKSKFTRFASIDSKSLSISNYVLLSKSTSYWYIPEKNYVGQYPAIIHNLCNLKIIKYCIQNTIAESLEEMFSISPIYSYNQSNSNLLYERHQQFTNYLTSIGIKSIVIEAIFQGLNQKYKVTKPNNEPLQIQLELEDPMYYRENLINVALKQLKNWEFALWIDAHQIFENPYWWEEAILLISRQGTAALYQNVMLQNLKNSTYYVRPAMVRALELNSDIWQRRGLAVFGNAWGINHQTYKKIGYISDEAVCMLPDGVYNCAVCKTKNCFVCKDSRSKYLNNFKSWEESARQYIGGATKSVRGDIIHLYHEKPKDLKSITEECYNMDFDIKRDLIRDSETMLLKLNNKKLKDLFQGFIRN